jgi:rhombotail lipoprotein
MRIISIVVFILFLSGCVASDMTGRLDRGMGKIPATQYSNANTVEEIRNLRPQAEIPLKIAVMPPKRWQGISIEERKVIETWGKKLKETGFVESLEIIPKSLFPACDYQSDSNCYLNESRIAGARLGADAILFLNDSTVTDSYINFAGILDITIVGMWVVPSHHRDSYSVYEASLFDINNGYLYAVSEGHGENKTLNPLMYTEYDTGQKDARVQALNDLGEKLLVAAKKQVNKLSPTSGAPE